MGFARIFQHNLGHQLRRAVRRDRQRRPILRIGLVPAMP